MIGEGVIYRSKAGVDLAAIITAVVDADEGWVQLEQFPPPGVAADSIDYQWGVPQHVGDREPRRGSWRWKPARELDA